MAKAEWYATTNCHQCGKEFERNPEWVFHCARKHKTIYFCSWSCLREYRKTGGKRGKKYAWEKGKEQEK